jgi:hypothetical protein
MGLPRDSTTPLHINTRPRPRLTKEFAHFFILINVVCLIFYVVDAIIPRHFSNKIKFLTLVPRSKYHHVLQRDSNLWRLHSRLSLHFRFTLTFPCPSVLSLSYLILLNCQLHVVSTLLYVPFLLSLSIFCTAS